MNSKKLISILLVLSLLAGLASNCALAEDGERAPDTETGFAEAAGESITEIAENEGAGTEAAETEITETEAAETDMAEAAEAGTAEAETAETLPEVHRLVYLSFTLDPAADLAIVRVMDAEGNTVRPVSGENGEPLYGSYLLPPGLYSYTCGESTDGSAYESAEPLVLDGTEGRVDVTVRLIPREPELPAAPVVFRCDSTDDFRGLAVADERGETIPPYTDPDTGEVLYGSYLLRPGAYRYSYHDAEGFFADREESFTVAEGGLQFIAVELARNASGLCFAWATVNPYYAGVIRAEILPTASTSPEESLAGLLNDLGAAGEFSADGQAPYGLALSAPPAYESAAAAGSALRRGLIQRQSEIGIRVKCKAPPTEELWRSFCEMILDEAFRHSGVPVEGDYLRFQYGGTGCVGSAFGPDASGDCYYEFIYAPLYFTSLEQENELSGRVGAVLGSLDPAGKGDEEKIRAVYRFLCDNVACDAGAFTAYDALVRGRAASQGVAVAFYRLCLELGLDARVVTSVETNCAWNIVRVDGQRYFALDAAGDAGRAPDEWSCYLRGRTGWQTGHAPGDEFADGRFDAYTFPAEDYGAADAALIHSVAVVFDGMLRIKYYFSFPERLMSMEGACLQFSKNGETFMVVPLAACKMEKGCRSCSCAVEAEEIGTPVQVKLLGGGGENLQIVSESGTIYPNGFFFSAMKYAEEMQENASSAAMRALARALADYGAAAQNYFGNGNGTIRDEVEAVTEADLSPWSAAVEGKKPAGVRESFLTAVLEADSSLRVYFRFEDGRDAASYACAVDGESAVLRRKSDGDCYLCVENISADELDRPHRFSISDGTDTCTFTASVLSYAEMLIRQGDRDAANLGKALYLYNRAADGYFGT